ncbi:MAG TPA: hypothetical protein VFY29_12210 [Terriglobia bacterium]|nr:hypothetical protein [Terriglobia bacterium]
MEDSSGQVMAMMWRRAFAVWVVFIVVESINGVFRRLVLESRIGDLSARQVSVFTGSVLILGIAYLLIDWIQARNRRQLAFVGMMWVGLTLTFELGAGRYLFDYSWDRILSDFNLGKGGFLGIGLLVMGLAPQAVSGFRGARISRTTGTRSLPGEEGGG